MLRAVIISLLFAIFAEAGTYPRLFSQMGTPLYEADERFAQYREAEALKEQMDTYHSLCIKTQAMGQDIESGRDVEKEEITAYFAALRVLQHAHDTIAMALETISNPTRMSRPPDSAEERVIMLSTSWCPACKQAREELHKQEIAFSEYDIERSKKGKQLYDVRKGYAIPMFIIGEAYRTGLSMEWMREQLK